MMWTVMSSAKRAARGHKTKVRNLLKMLYRIIFKV